MRSESLPQLSLRFWILITCASVFGANLGDFCSHELGLGHWRGMPFLAVIFIAILSAERVWTSTHTELFYWLAVLAVRTSATNLADLATHDLHVDDAALLAALGLPLLALAAARDRMSGWLEAPGKPRVDSAYWVAMLLASSFGTVLGDASAGLVGLVTSTFAWAVLWTAGTAIVARPALLPALAYWPMVCVVRTFGTNLGDGMAGRHGLALGLPTSTALSGALFFLLFVAWRPARRAMPAE